MCAELKPGKREAPEGYIPVGRSALYCCEAGSGKPIVVIHGGPDFSHSYLRPDLDRLSDVFRFIYYDQRGRGQSARNVRIEDVGIESEIADVEAVREHFRLESIAVLGHSWGAVMALEYAIRHPRRVSHLVLMNPGPASHDDYLRFRTELKKRRTPHDADAMRALAAGNAFRAGNPDAVAEYYRFHFRTAVRRTEDLERMIARLRSNFTKENVLTARAIETRLVGETWLKSDYDLLPQLTKLRVPALVIRGDGDFIPRECATHIAASIPEARFVELAECGHFAHLERPDSLREVIADFFTGTSESQRSV